MRRPDAPRARRAATRTPGWGRLDVAAAIAALSKPLPPQGPVRDERRRRVPLGEDHREVGNGRHREGDGRLLGRPGRRLRAPARAREARLPRADGRPRRCRPQPRPLVARDEVHRGRPRVPLRARVSARPGQPRVLLLSPAGDGDVLRAGAHVEPGTTAYRLRIVKAPSSAAARRPRPRAARARGCRRRGCGPARPSSRLRRRRRTPPRRSRRRGRGRRLRRCGRRA